MSLPKGERRKIIEDLLDLEIFSTMNILLKGKIDECDDSIRQLEHLKNTNEEKLNLVNGTATINKKSYRKIKINNVLDDLRIYLKNPNFNIYD